MAMIETWLRQNLRQPVVVHRLDGNLFSGDNQGNKIGVIVTDNNETVDLDDSCFGYFIRSDGATIPIEGTASGNTAYVVLPASCYVCIGQFSFVLKVGTTTLAACTGYIYRTSTDTIVDPGSVVPSLSELLDKISDCETATAEAENVNISHTKVGPVITITTTDRDGQTEESTIREPTISVTKHGTEDPVPSREGDFDITVISSNGTEVVTNTVTIPNPNAELSDRAHIGSISRSKTRTGNPIQIEDAVNEIADKMVIKLVPKQDLHGYSRPWVGGAGKNLANFENGYGLNTSGAVVTNAQRIATRNPIPITQNQSYVLSFASGLGAGYAVYNGSTYVRRVTSVTSGTEININDGDNIYINVFRGGESSSTAPVTVDEAKAQFEKGSTATAYEPFENLCPISGYDTVNVGREAKDLLKDAKRINNYYLDAQGTPGAATGTYYYTEFIPVEGGKTYVFEGTNGANSTNNRRVHEYDAGGNWIKQSSHQIAANADFQVVAETDARTKYVKLSGGMLDPVEHFHLPTATYPIAVSLATNGNQTAGTVYSGTVTLLADGSGQVVVDKRRVKIGDFTWAKTGTNNFYVVESALPSQVSTSVEGISSAYECFYGSFNDFKLLDYGMQLSNVTFSSTAKNIVIRDAQYADDTPANFRAARADVDICYPLGTPLTYTLTANQVQTLLGYNYIYTDGAEIALTYRQESLATNETLLKLLPTGTATGNPVTFSDGANDIPLKRLVVNVEPKQEGSGTPSPTNIRPISGWNEIPLVQTGKNLILVTATSGIVNNVAVTVNDDGTVKLHGTANADGTITLASGIPTKGGETYQLTGCPSEGVYNSTYWLNYFGTGVDEDGNDVFLSTYTAGNISGGIASEYDLTGTVSIKFKNGTVFNNIVFSPMLSNNSLSYDYEPGVEKKTYSIALPSEAGTVYGCQIVLDENGEGTLTVNRTTVEAPLTGWDTSLNWGTMLHQTLAVGGLINVDQDNLIICSHAKPVSNTQMYNQRNNTNVPAIVARGTNTQIRIRLDSVASTPEEYLAYFAAQKAAGTPVTFTYKLATPVTYSLTADQVKTLLGTNIISSDAGNIEVTYFADICKKIEALIRSNP